MTTKILKIISLLYWLRLAVQQPESIRKLAPPPGLEPGTRGLQVTRYYYRTWTISSPTTSCLLSSRYVSGSRCIVSEPSRQQILAGSAADYPQSHWDFQQFSCFVIHSFPRKLRFSTARCSTTELQGSGITSLI